MGDEDAEITMEMNPGTVNENKLKDYYNCGINRLSIGLQETNNALLKEIGRIHTYEDFKNTYSLVRNVGFKNINVDLMLGLPNQSILDLENSINKIINLNPEHISVCLLYTSLCGDVGYGKTEVAIRIAFKAVMDQKMCIRDRNKFIEELSEIAVPEKKPILEGKNMFIILAKKADK